MMSLSLKSQQRKGWLRPNGRRMTFVSLGPGYLELRHSVCSQECLQLKTAWLPPCHASPVVKMLERSFLCFFSWKFQKFSNLEGGGKLDRHLKPMFLYFFCPWFKRMNDSSLSFSHRLLMEVSHTEKSWKYFIVSTHVPRIWSVVTVELACPSCVSAFQSTLQTAICTQSLYTVSTLLIFTHTSGGNIPCLTNACTSVWPGLPSGFTITPESSLTPPPGGRPCSGFPAMAWFCLFSRSLTLLPVPFHVIAKP